MTSKKQTHLIISSEANKNLLSVYTKSSKYYINYQNDTDFKVEIQVC